MLYPENTILRYYLDTCGSSDHYTAVVLHSGQILQVKPQKQMFDSIQLWLDTLPGQPTAMDLKVEEHLGAEVDPSWNTINNGQQWQLGRMTWPAYLYKVIMKYNANLKNNEELRDAFNHLVQVLEEHKSICFTYIPFCLMKYYENILLRNDQPYLKEWELLPINFYNTKQPGGLYAIGSRVAKEAFVPKIYEAYKPLYELFEKHGLLAWVRAEQLKLEKKPLQVRIKRAETALRRIQRKKKNIEAQEANQMLHIYKLQEELKMMQ